MITAKVICDSVNPQGNRLTTFELRYPKFIHGEFMTHRVFSRNASSSRAIPTEKLIEEVRSDADRASFVFWGKNQKGMQAAEELDDERAVGTELAESLGYFGTVIDLTTSDGKELINVPVADLTARTFAKMMWSEAAHTAADAAETMLNLDVHKQIVNRVLEPYSHINVVCTATEYMNFFGLRLDKAAQPEARALAEAMWRGFELSRPKPLQPGEWHLPYIDLEDSFGLSQDSAIKMSVARCARVSYRSFETGNISTIEEDLKLYDRLVGSHPMHASPAEHQATPDDKSYTNGPFGWDHPDEHGNFVGWRQYRKMLPGEACAPLPDEYRHSPDV